MATWDHAAFYAQLHPDSIRKWNRRGEAALADHDTLADFAATDPYKELLAYAAFYVAGVEARTTPVMGALDQIDRARKAGDWKAAAHILRVLPQAREYTEVTRQEVQVEDNREERNLDAEIAAALGEAAG